MSTFKKKDINELVGGDMNSDGGDRNVTNDSEIETGPVQKPYNDDSDYEKGVSTTTDRVTGRYRQDIPWFAVYSYGGSGYGRGRGLAISEKKVVMKKKAVEEKIDDLVKKSKNTDVTGKDYNPKVSKIIDAIKNTDLTEKQIEDIKNAISDKKNNKSTTKTL